MNGSGCKTCAVYPNCTAEYRGSSCKAIRDEFGLGDPMTNGDRIRAMSDEELAKVINAFSAYFESCNRSANEVDCKDCELYKLCTIFEGQAMDWLEKPAEDTPC